jgi:hypothetical protein
MWIDWHFRELGERATHSAGSNRFVDECILCPELPENGYLVDPSLVGDTPSGRAPISVPGIDPSGRTQ